MLMLELFSLLIIVTVTSAQEGNTIGRRVPSFIASRGKKNDATDVEKEVASFDYESVDRLDDRADDARYPVSKRAYLGFQGTRGKKIADFSNKRAVGFTASRGKKYDPSSIYLKTDIDDYWILKNELAKRKFYGMRGKKIPFVGSAIVMGVRGKKGPNPGATFFGTRGKKDDVLLGSSANTRENSDRSKPVENLATMMYLLSADSKDYSRHHPFDDLDLEIPSDLDSLTQDQQMSSDET